MGVRIHMIHETCLLSAKQATFRKMEKFVERFWSWAWLSIRVTAASIPKMIRKYSLRTFTTWFSSIYVFLRIVSSHSYQNLYQSRLQALNIPIQNTKKGVAPWHLTEGVQKGGHRWGHSCGNDPAHGMPTWPRHRTWPDCDRDPGLSGRWWCLDLFPKAVKKHRLDIFRLLRYR